MANAAPSWTRRLVARRQTSWIGCIDFGTAYSKVAMVAAEDPAELRHSDVRPLPIGRNVALNPFLLPSLVFVADDAILFAREAEQAALRAQQAGREAFSSLKQFLSTHDAEDLESSLPPAIDPTGAYTPRNLLALYLAYLLKRAEDAALEQKLPWPPKFRIARPAWKRERAHWGEQTLRKLIKDAFVLLDYFDGRLSATHRVPHAEAKAAFKALAHAPEVADDRIFELSESGHATVLEATAVAAGSIRPTGRRVVVVADIGGGTSDFAAFMTGLSGRNVVAELAGSAEILREAGDHLDMLLRSFILKQAGLLPDDVVAHGPSNRIKARQRTYKEELFNNGRLVVDVNDHLVEIVLGEFLACERVKQFSHRLKEKFLLVLDKAIDCAAEFSTSHRVPIEIMPTGGGHDLPMVREMVKGVERDWPFVTASPDLVQAEGDPDFVAALRQLTVSIGGAVRDLPKQTSPVRITCANRCAPAASVAASL
jgi:molecular chaperone DnaK (HSP70)